ncbi:MAG: hypothetical protein Q9164_006854 [Protoblastenia rupestris]
MSYGRLHHDNTSRYMLHRSSDPSSPLTSHGTDSESDFGSEEDVYIDTDGYSPVEYEMKDLSKSINGNTTQSHEYEEDLKDSLIEGSEKVVVHKTRRGSASTTQSFMLYTPDEEGTIINKFDCKLVLFVAFLYMLSFLDRSNIGNARVAGMYNDLHLSSAQFEWLLRVFYITYIAFEWMTLLWKVFPPHIYLAICVASWGLIASLQSLAISFWSMLTLRACLGIGEAAFVGIPFYLSFFYKRDELAFRTGLFISAAPLATSFAGSLGWAVTKLGDHLPIASWRILFLLEGFPSIIVAIFVYLHIPDGPLQAKYLTARERKVAKLRLRKEQAVSTTGTEKHGIKWHDVRQTLLDPTAYLTASMFFCCNVAFSSLPVFLPTIIQEMGFSPLASQALSAPPYLTAFFAVLLTAYLSDRLRTRSAFVIFHALLAASGYAMMAIAGSLHATPMIRYIGVYPASMGFFSAVTIIITWTINNQESDSGKGTGLAMLNYIGQLGPLVGVHLYPDRDQPYYVKGMAICAGFMGMVAVLAFGLRMILLGKNRRVPMGIEGDGGEAEGLVGLDRRKRRRFVFMI